MSEHTPDMRYTLVDVLRADIAKLTTDRDDLIASNADLTVDYESARQHIRHQQEELDKLTTDRDALYRAAKLGEAAADLYANGHDCWPGHCEDAARSALIKDLIAQAERGDA